MELPSSLQQLLRHRRADLIGRSFAREASIVLCCQVGELPFCRLQIDTHLGTFGWSQGTVEVRCVEVEHDSFLVRLSELTYLLRCQRVR